MMQIVHARDYEIRTKSHMLYRAKQKEKQWLLLSPEETKDLTFWRPPVPLSRDPFATSRGTHIYISRGYLALNLRESYIVKIRD